MNSIALIRNVLNKKKKLTLSLTGRSMEPTLFEGNTITVVPADRIDVGEIILYEFDNNIILHRVVDVYKNWIVTKGDSHEFCDDVIHRSQVLGKMQADKFLMKSSEHGRVNRDIRFKIHDHTPDERIKDVLLSSFVQYNFDKKIDEDRVNIGVVAMANLHLWEVPAGILENRNITLHFNIKVSNTKRNSYLLIDDFQYLVRLCGRIPHSLLSIDQQMLMALGIINTIGGKANE